MSDPTTIAPDPCRRGHLVQAATDESGVCACGRFVTNESETDDPIIADTGDGASIGWVVIPVDAAWVLSRLGY